MRRCYSMSRRAPDVTLIGARRGAALDLKPLEAEFALLASCKTLA